jgi:lipopolysaccharide export system protein LptC
MMAPASLPPGGNVPRANSRPGARTNRTDRLIGGSTRKLPSTGAIRRRRWLVGAGKRLLPLVALALLGLVALWPEFTREFNQARLIGRGLAVVPQNGQLTNARYRGEDARGQAYTITAATARQVTPERIDMTLPIGDITLSGGAWMHVTAQGGTYMQKAEMLDLSGEVTLYRDDGTTLTADAITLDLHAGAAASPSPTHVEGPFGTMDAQGFTVTDRGNVAFFTGPAHLVLRGRTP